MSGLSGSSGAGPDGLPAVRRPLPPEPSSVASMHGRLVEYLGAGIALGRISGTLDPDRIADRFAVSRSVVREALRTLAAKGMVVARQRAGTRVTEPAAWASLDEQVIRWCAAGPGRFRQMNDSLEIRERLEPLAARRMAERGDPEAVAALADAARQIEQATRSADGALMLAADTAFHRALYLGSGSDLLAELAGTVHACLRVPDFQRYQRFSPHTAQRHQRLAEVVAAGDGPAAEQACADVIALTIELFHSATAQLLREHRARTARDAGSAEVAGRASTSGADSARRSC